jgi:hypothetical protein
MPVFLKMDIPLTLIAFLNIDYIPKSILNEVTKLNEFIMFN